MEKNLMELLELYMDLTDKQDEIISQLGMMVTRQANDLQVYEDEYKYFNINNVNGAFKQYKALKQKIEP